MPDDPAQDAEVQRAAGAEPTQDPEAMAETLSHETGTAPGAGGESWRLPGGRYRVVGEIARGGMGAVLRVFDNEVQRPLAVKVMLGEEPPDALRAERFLEEARITGQLQHPGVPPVHEIGRPDGARPFFSMKLIEGRTLSQLLDERSSPQADLPRLLKIFEQIAQTLAYAHAQGIIHRDLKPSNVMVGPFGEVQVMDWGLAKRLADGPMAAAPSVEHPGDAGLTQAGQVLGTPAYMPPEQARGEIDRLDERSDVFGLGAILCRILTGAPPYAAKDGMTALRMAAGGELEDAYARLDASGTDQELTALARSCLAAEPGDRPSSAGAVAEAVAAYQESVQTRLREAELAEARAVAQAAAERRRRRATLGMAASVLLTIAVGLGGWLWIQHDQQARAEALIGEVDAALEKAHSLRGEAKAAAVGDLSKHREAVVAVQLAESLAAGDDAGESTRQRVARILREVQSEEAVARAKAERAKKLEVLLATLRDVRERHSEAALGSREFDYDATDARYAAAFKTYGLDVQATSAADVARHFEGEDPDVVAELAAALDHWIVIRQTGMGGIDPLRQSLLQVAKQLDKDPLRTRLREEVFEFTGDQPDAARIRALIDDADVNGTPVQSLYMMGRALAQSGDPATADELMRAAQLEHPDDFWLNYARAVNLAYDTPPRYDEAARCLAAAVAIRPESATAWYGLGVMQTYVNEHAGAASAYRRALRLQPGHLRARHNLGVALWHLGQLDEAETEFRAVIAQDPDFALAHGQLGIVLSMQHRAAEALASFEEAARLDHDDATAQFNLGNALAALRRTDDALAAWRQANQLGLRDATAYDNIGITENARGNVDAAITAWREAVRMEPRRAKTHNQLGLALRSRGLLDEAVAAHQRAVEIAPANASYHYNLGIALRTKKRLDEALIAFRRAAQLDAENPLRHLNLAVTLQESGRIAEALLAFEEAQRAAEGKPVVARQVSQFRGFCETFAALKNELPALLHADRPSLPVGKLLLAAKLCAFHGLHGAAARFYAAAFEADASLPGRSGSRTRYDAACSAARAAAGQSHDAWQLDDAQRERWRGQALAWLRDELAAWSSAADGGSSKTIAAVQTTLRSWQRDDDLATIRESADLEELPAVDRADFTILWADVADLLARCQDAEP